MRRIMMLTALLAISALGIGAQSLTELLDAAVQSDPGVAIAKETLEQRLIQAELDDTESFLSFEAGTGTVRYSRADTPRPGEPENTLDVAPTVAVNLATPLGTTLSLSVPVTLDLDLGDWDEITPTISLTQPLNEILGLVDDTTEELEKLYQITEAQINLTTELLSVESDVLATIRDVLDLEWQIGEAQLDLAEARADLDEARALGTYTEESSGLALLVATVERASRQVEYLESSRSRTLDSLQRVVGIPVDELPQDLPGVDLVLPSTEDANRNPDVHLARMSLAVKESGLEDQVDPGLPELSMTGTYKRGIDETKALYFSTEVTWSPANRNQDRLTEQSLTADIHIAEEEKRQAYQDYLDDRDTVALELLDLERREEDLEMDRITAELALTETLALHRGGLAGDEELVRAEWGLDEIDYDDRLLTMDRLIAQVQLRGLTMDDEEAEE